MAFKERTRPGIWRSGRPTTNRRSAKALARAAGRVVLWLVIAVVLIRGIGAIAGGGESARAPEAVGAGTGFPDAEARVFAARFAAAYLDASAGGTGRGHGRRVARFLSEGLSDRAMPVVSRRILGARVAWAMVARKRALGASRALITVATTSHDGQPAAKNSKPVTRRPAKPSCNP